MGSHRRVVNGLGALTGEGEIIPPISDNEMYVRVWTRVVGGIVLIVTGLLIYNLWNTKMLNDVSRYAIDRGAWTCGYDAKGKPHCGPQSEKK